MPWPGAAWVTQPGGSDLRLPKIHWGVSRQVFGHSHFDLGPSFRLVPSEGLFHVLNPVV